MDFLDELQQRILPGDAAMDMALRAAGATGEACLAELCVSRPEWLRTVHEQAIAAGARLIRTNTFGANAVRLARHGHERRVSEINWSAAQLAKDVVRGTGVHVAGSVGPLGLTAAEAETRGLDREAVFTEQIGALLDGGARVIFLEGFLALEELLVAVEVKHALHHCPVIASLACPRDGRLADGTTLAQAFAKLRAAEADVVGINDVDGPALAVRLLDNHGDDGPLAAFPNAGPMLEPGGRVTWQSTTGDFVDAVPALAGRGVRLFGGSGGTTAAHVQAITLALAPPREGPLIAPGGESR